jgi:hypothetical protein
VAEADVYLWVAKRAETANHGAGYGNGREALFNVVAVTLKVVLDEGFEGGAIVGVDGSLVQKDVGHRERSVSGPVVQCGHQGRLVDHPGLQDEQACQEVRFGRWRHRAALRVLGR